MNFSKADLRQIDNLVKALKKGNFTLDGMEVLAMSDAMKWFNNFYIVASEEVKLQESVATNPIKENPIEPEKVESKKKKK